MRRWRVLWCLLAIGYLAAWAAIAFLPISTNDMDGQYWPAVREVIAGHPLHLYSPHGAAAGPDHGPVSLMVLTVAGYALTVLGWMDNDFARRAMASAVIGLICVLMSREAIRSVESLRGEPVTSRTRLWISCALLLFPALVAGGVYGHIELPISMWLLLVSVRRLDNDRTGGAGILLGLALLARSTSALFVLPVALAVLRQRGMRAALTLAGATTATVAAGLAPFVIADPAGVRHSLIEVRANLPLRNGTLLSLVQNTPLAGAARHGDVALMVAAAVIVTLLMPRPGPGARIQGPQLLAMLMGVAVCYPLLAKSVWPYYLFEASVFGMVLWFGEWTRGRRWRVGIPVLLIVAVSVMEAYQVIAAGSEAGTTVGVISSGLLALAIRESIRIGRALTGEAGRSVATGPV